MFRKYDLIELTNGTKILVRASILYHNEEYIIGNRMLSDEVELMNDIMIFEVLPGGALLQIDTALYGTLFAEFMKVL